MQIRLDYVVPGSAEVQNKQVARTHPSRPQHTLRYHLSPFIARYSVSQHFPEQSIEKHADGSATITAKVTNLFEARRILLSYGEYCTVLGPPELLAQMRSVAHHYRVYLTAEE
jgi:WYL domain